MTDPVEPPDVASWKRRAETAEAALAIADRNARNRGQVADEAVARALTAEAERDRLRDALRLIVDVTMDLGEQLDRIPEVATDALAGWLVRYSVAGLGADD